MSLKFDPVLARVLLAGGGAALGVFVLNWIVSTIIRAVRDPGAGAMRVDLFLAIGFLIIAAGSVAGARRV